MKRISRDVFSRIALLWRCLWFVKLYDKPHVKQAQLDTNASSSAKLKIQKFVLESHKFSLKTVWTSWATSKHATRNCFFLRTRLKYLAVLARFVESPLGSFLG